MHAIPWITQYASPELIGAIAYEGHPKADDPRWAESGAPDLEAYGFWCSRWCGMACLRMALIARDGDAPTLYELVTGCEEYGGYVREADGSVTGLVYRPFAEYVRDKHDLRADVITDLDSARLTTELDAGRLVMASVTPEIRRPSQPPHLHGGHLVLMTGHEGGAVTFHNPSGHTPEAGIATLPIDVFDRFAAHRGVALHV